MINKIKQAFFKKGYVSVVINGREVLTKGNIYHRIDYVKDWDEYIIESADSKEAAENNLFEDSDYIQANATDEEIEEIVSECQ